MINSSEKENAIIELLRQRKPYSVIEQQLHISSRDISHTKKKYAEQQNKKQSQSEVHSEVVPSDSREREPYKDQKCDHNAGTMRQDHQGVEEIRRLNIIIFSQREEIQVLKDGLKRACIKRRSGIIAMKTEWLYDEVRFLLNRDVEYCYLIYEDNKKRLVDALQYEDDLTKKIERAKEQPIQETTNRLEIQNDGSIF